MFGGKTNEKLCGFDKKPCIKQQCQFWIHLIGLNHNTGQETDVWDCSFRWLPNLITEVRGATAGVAASVQDFRNHVIVQNNDLMKLEQRKLDVVNGRKPLPDG